MTQLECCKFKKLANQLDLCEDALVDALDGNPPELIGSASGSASGASSTNAINTTGANFIVINISAWGVTSPSVTDNKGNTYTKLTARSAAGTQVSLLAYCKAPIVGPNHIFTASGAAGAVSIISLAFSNMDEVAPFDIENGQAAGGVFELTTGPIAPSQPKTLIITGVAMFENLGYPISVDSGFLLTGSTPHSGSTAGSGMAFKVVNNTQNHNAKWKVHDSIGIQSVITSIAAFKWGVKPVPALQTARLVLTTHNGNNIPLGLYQDAAATTPSTAEGHPVRSWKDLRNGQIVPIGSGSVPAVLNFISGVPLISIPTGCWFQAAGISWGIDLALVVIAYEATGPTPFCVFNEGPSTSSFTLYLDNSGYPGMFSTARHDILYSGISATGRRIASILSSGSAYKAWYDGVLVGMQNGLSFNNTGSKICIGRSDGSEPTTQFIGRVQSIVIHSDENKRTEIETTIKSLYPPATATVVASTNAGTSAAGGFTPSIDTSGANFIAVNLAYYNSGTLNNFTDSMGNSYTALDKRIDAASGAVQQLFYCENPIVGPDHTFQVNGVTIFAAIQVAAFALDGFHAGSFNEQSGGHNAGTQITVGPVNQGSMYSLVMAGVAFSDVSLLGPHTSDTDFTIVESTPYVFGAHFGGGLAYKFSTVSTSHLITWDLIDPMSGISASIASFNL